MWRYKIAPLRQMSLLFGTYRYIIQCLVCWLLKCHMVLISFYPVVRDRHRQPEPQALLHMNLLLLRHSTEQSNELLRNLPAEETCIPDEIGRQASRNEVSVEQEEENSTQEASSTTTQRHLPVQALTRRGAVERAGKTHVFS
jgi:hypothetical protein